MAPVLSLCASLTCSTVARGHRPRALSPEGQGSPPVHLTPRTHAQSVGAPKNGSHSAGFRILLLPGPHAPSLTSCPKASEVARRRKGLKPEPFASHRGHPADAGTFLLASRWRGRRAEPETVLQRPVVRRGRKLLTCAGQEGGRERRSLWRWISHCYSGPASRP